MPRPRKCCYIAQPPAVAGMRPVGGDSVAPEAVTLRYDEYEAIRLIDHQGLTQAAAAERMGISRPTCTRLYDRARRTLAAAIPSDTTKFDDYDTIRNDSGRMVRRIAAGSLRKFGAG